MCASVFPSTLSKMMPAQLVNVGEACLGTPPSTAEFFTRLEQHLGQVPAASPDSTDANVVLYGEAAAQHVPQPPKGSVKVAGKKEASGAQGPPHSAQILLAKISDDFSFRW